MSIVHKEFRVGGVLTNATSVLLSDAGGTYGIKRNDTGAVVVADGTAMVNTAVGIYDYTFTDPALDLTYTAWFELVYAGATYRDEFVFAGPTSTTVAQSALTTLDAAKAYLGRSDFQHREVGLDVYCSQLDATSATVQVTDTDLVLVIVGGLEAGIVPLSFALAANDTLAELVTAINAVTGWTANLAAYPDEDSTNLVVMPPTACLTEANTIALMVVPNELLQDLIYRASDLIEKICDRQFNQRNYAERYNGDGTDIVILKNYPVSAVGRVCIGNAGVMTVTNSSTDAMYATATVTTSVVTLTIVGGANVGTDSPDFATYTTITTLVAQINALGKGWSASVAASTYGAFPSNELIEFGAQSCLSQTASLYVPGAPSSGYRMDKDDGCIYLSSGFSAGFRNVYVEYTAGYPTIPDDLEHACLEVVAYLYGLVGEAGGMQTVRSDNWDYTREGVMDGLPKSTQQSVYKYKNWSGGS